MNKRIFVVLTVFLLLCGCVSATNQEQKDIYAESEKSQIILIEEINTVRELVFELNNKVIILEEKNKILEENMVEEKNKQDIIVKTLGIAQSFIEYYLKNDTEKMRGLVVDSINLTNDYISYDVEGEEIKLPINNLGDLNYRINNFGIENDTIHYQYMVYEEPSKGALNGFFINITLKLIDGKWQIDSITYDI